MRRSPIAFGLGAAALLLTACTGVDVGVGTGGGSASGTMTGSGASGLGALTAPYVVLDLATGAVEPRATVPDLATGSAYRGRSLVFRRVVGNGPDLLIAAFETTQAQWLTIAGSAAPPWDGAPVAVVGGAAVADDRPAFNLSYAGVAAGLATWNAGRPVRLALPTGDQWTFAAGGGSAQTYWWGAATDRATLLARAVVAEVADGTPGAQPVGGRQANAFGLYDTVGNVWEWTDGGTALRGGSWYDGVAVGGTRAVLDAATAGLTPATAHVLAGVRLILVL